MDGNLALWLKAAALASGLGAGVALVVFCGWQLHSLFTDRSALDHQYYIVDRSWPFLWAVIIMAILAIALWMAQGFVSRANS